MSTYCFSGFCGLAGWPTGPGLAWPGCAPSGLTPGLTPEGLGSLTGSKGLPAPGDSEPQPHAQASFCFQHIYCCALLAKANHMATPGAGEETTQGEEAEMPSANDRLPRPKPGGRVLPSFRGVDRGCSLPARGWM